MFDRTFSELTGGLQTVGKFEVEFQNAQGATLDVAQNKAPGGAAPAGFKFLDPTSFTVNLKEGGTNLTLGKIDYIFDTASEHSTKIPLRSITS